MRKNPKIQKFKSEYSEKNRKFKSLAINLKQSLKSLLAAKNIDYFNISFRVKTEDSCLNKIRSKGYTEPVEEIEDICGLRIICFYLTDVNKISKLIEEEFEVVNSVDKTENLNENEFGYRSRHYVVKVKPEWCNVPNYKELKDLKAEIQIRTISMHAWAAIEHKLSYKSKGSAPSSLRRRLYKISALLELVDEQFEKVRDQKDAIIKNLEKSKGRSFDLGQEVNAESFRFFSRVYLQDRVIDTRTHLMELLIKSGVSFQEIVNSLNMAGKSLKEIEADLFKQELINIPKLTASGAIVILLDLTNDRFWELRKKQPYMNKGAVEFVEEWREKLKSNSKNEQANKSKSTTNPNQS